MPTRAERLRHKVFPVIHHRDAKTSREQADLAFHVGADGVFLISHHGQNDELFTLAHAIKAAHPQLKVGINLLGVSAYDAYLRIAMNKVDMMWTDTPGVTSLGTDDGAKRIAMHLINGPRGPVVYGSVAFKYQPYEGDPAGAARAAAALGMLPTTSGASTGNAPSVSKARAMSEALGGGPLAVASGMTPENVDDFLPYFTHYLVATGVSLDDYHFDLARLRTFVEKVHGYKPTLLRGPEGQAVHHA